MLKTLALKKDLTIFKNITLVIASALILGMFAKIYIPLFFTPVPLILQNSIAICYGTFFKPKIAATGVLLFIFLGMIGLPFFSNGNFGINYFLGATGGYILAYFISACVIAKLKEQNRLGIFNIALIGHMIILAIGSLWLAMFVGFYKAILLGFLPFIATDILKSVFIAKFYKKIKG